MPATRFSRLTALFLVLAAPVLTAGCTAYYPGGPGNNPVQGRFYDRGDNYRNWDTGTTYPGAPGDSHGG
jgi:hypothetical protein